MKNLYLAGVLVVLCLGSIRTKAQELSAVNQPILNKPLLFASFPEKIECRLAELQRIFASAKSDKLSLVLNEKFSFAGEITERVQKSGAVISMNIRSSNFPGALFTISQITQAGRPVRYIGRIVHPKQGDCWIISEENNHYYLKKQAIKYFMTE